jgi:hypothetical protein
MPAPVGATILRGMTADVFIFMALELAAVLGMSLFVVTVLVLGSVAVDADAHE